MKSNKETDLQCGEGQPGDRGLGKDENWGKAVEESCTCTKRRKSKSVIL